MYQATLLWRVGRYDIPKNKNMKCVNKTTAAKYIYIITIVHIS